MLTAFCGKLPHNITTWSCLRMSSTKTNQNIYPNNRSSNNIVGLEEKIEIIKKDAKAEEIENCKHNYGILKELKDEVEANIPNPDEEQCYDYEGIGRKQEAIRANKKRRDEAERINKYFSNGTLYLGHLSTHKGNYYITEKLDTDVFRVGQDSFILINTDDSGYSQEIYNWRNPKEDDSVIYSRNIDMKDKKVISVEIVFDKNEKLFSKITDPYLRNTLAKNKDNGNIRSIIQTIQKTQDKIRTKDKNMSFVVQGCAGSGKTMVLLHRIRYLVHNKYIDNNNFIFLVSGFKFKNYIKEISEDFKINTNNILPVSEYYRICADGKPSKDSEDTDELVFGNKYLSRVYSKEFIIECYYSLTEVYKNQVNSLIESCKSILNKMDNVSKQSQTEKGNKNSKEAEVLNAFIEDSTVLDNEFFDYAEKLLPSYNFFEQHCNIGRKAYNVIYFHIEKEKDKEKFRTNHSFFSSKKTEKQLKAYLYTLMFNACKRKVKDEFDIVLNKLYKHYWFLNLYSRYLAYGDIPTKYRYIFIDETQDLSQTELELIYRINSFKKNTTIFNPVMNLFGDINQMISSFGLQTWSDIKFIHEAPFKLNENFRNPNQIIRFCNKNLPFKMEEIGVDMEEVSVFEEWDSLYSALDGDLSSCTFIVKDEYYRKDLQHMLDRFNITDCQIFTVKEVKGFQFKETFVVDSDMTDNEKYVSYTRALKKLNVIHNIPKLADRNESLIIQGNDTDEENEQTDFDEVDSVNDDHNALVNDPNVSNNPKDYLDINLVPENLRDNAIKVIVKGRRNGKYYLVPYSGKLKNYVRGEKRELLFLPQHKKTKEILVPVSLSDENRLIYIKDTNFNAYKEGLSGKYVLELRKTYNS